MNEYCYKLWKSNVDSTNVRFLHHDDLPSSGFISVYSYTKADAESMQSLGSYKGFKGSVYSPYLFIDCDTEEASKAVERRLEEKGIGYEKYSTGNRGSHFHVSRLCDANHFLPSCDKNYVASNFTGADISIYHHVAMYRQVGAVHRKTGGRKELIYKRPGIAIDLRGSKPAAEKFEDSEYSDMQSVFTDSVLKNLTVPINKGERRARYIEIGLALSRLNQPYDYAFAYLANVNLMAEEVLEDKELHRILDWVYNKRT